MTRSRWNISHIVVLVQQNVWPSSVVSFVEFGEGLFPSFVSVGDVYWSLYFNQVNKENAVLHIKSIHYYHLILVALRYPNSSCE